MRTYWDLKLSYAGLSLLPLPSEPSRHRGTPLRAPGLTLVFLPPHSPELQPVERVWPLVDEPLANRAFRSLAELERVLEDRCVRLTEMPEVIRAYSLFHWWPLAQQ